MTTNAHEEMPRGTGRLSETVIGCAMRVHSALGCGFLEKVYENALVIELRRAGLRVEQQKPLPIYYEGELVGDYFADLIVDGKLLVELKAISTFSDVHVAVCLNYLAATRLPVCLLVNFGGPRLVFRRLVGASYSASPEAIR